jgi:anhydro-N-acetylmuramic acid kinase
MSKVYRVLGLMSGTSLDGIDAAILETDGETIFGFGPAQTTLFSEETKANLSTATQAALAWNFEGPAPNSLAQADWVVDNSHIGVIECLPEWTFDLIGYHGQTILHRPDKLKTLQLGKGESLANTFGRPVVYDFRSEDVNKGGQGAPLAPIYHKALVEWSKLEGVTAVLNLGGVGNITIVSRETLLASDTGPANGPLDSWLGEVDRDGVISRKGEVDFARVDHWLERDFFKRSWPKSADRYDFDVLGEMKGMSREDGAATLCQFTASSVLHTLQQMQVRPDRLVVCGGGRYNRTILTILSLGLGCPVLPAEHYDWDSDAIEAQAFAYLAVRVLRGLPNSFPTTTGVPEPMVGGRIAYPV